MSVQQDNFKAIADAIREKEGTTDLIKPSEFAERIINLSVGSDFYDGLQNYGERKDYAYAFARNASMEIVPTYPFINITNVQYMFLQAENVIDLSNITVNITNKNPNMMYFCCNCYKMKKPPVLVFDTENVSCTKTWTSAYANCISMTDCEIYLGNGSSDPVTYRNSFQNTFLKCKDLVNLTFSGSGSPLYLDLSDCVNLSYESLISLKNAVADVSKATSGDYTIKISADSFTLLNEEDIAVFTNKGWILAVEEEKQ